MEEWTVQPDELLARDLSRYDEQEIVKEEGLKHAHEVAEEFRIETARVRKIWDDADWGRYNG